MERWPEKFGAHYNDCATCQKSHLHLCATGKQLLDEAGFFVLRDGAIVNRCPHEDGVRCCSVCGHIRWLGDKDCPGYREDKWPAPTEELVHAHRPRRDCPLCGAQNLPPVDYTRPQKCPHCGLLHWGTTACHVPVLVAALDGVPLDERDRRYLRWLAGQDWETVEVLSGLFLRARGSEESYRQLVVRATSAGQVCADGSVVRRLHGVTVSNWKEVAHDWYRHTLHSPDWPAGSIAAHAFPDDEAFGWRVYWRAGGEGGSSIASGAASTIKGARDAADNCLREHGAAFADAEFDGCGPFAATRRAGE